MAVVSCTPRGVHYDRIMVIRELAEILREQDRAAAAEERRIADLRLADELEHPSIPDPADWVAL